jgi:hypothetical protein
MLSTASGGLATAQVNSFCSRSLKTDAEELGNWNHRAVSAFEHSSFGHGEGIVVQYAIKRAVRSAYDIFASAHNTVLAQFLIVLLLGLVVLSSGR